MGNKAQETPSTSSSSGMVGTSSSGSGIGKAEWEAISTPQNNGKKVVISGVPSHMSNRSLKELVCNCGPVVHFKRLNSSVVLVTYLSSDGADAALWGIDGFAFEGKIFKVERAIEQPQSRSARVGQSQAGSARKGQTQASSAEKLQADSVRGKGPQAGGAHVEQQQASSAHVGQQQAGSAHVEQQQAGSAHVGQQQAGSAHVGQQQAGSAHVKQHQAGSAHVGQQKAGSAHVGQQQAGSVRAEQPQHFRMMSAFPLRILVPNNVVGAIIGPEGTIVQRITRRTHARIEIHRNETIAAEKQVWIYGNPEGCTNACMEILEIMQEESTDKSQLLIVLKMMAHDSLIGRLIGIAGANIKEIMNISNTRIYITKFDESQIFPSFEDVIVISGVTFDDVCSAESMVSAKLRESYENDMMFPQPPMYSMYNPMAMMAAQGFVFSQMNGFPHNYPPRLFGAAPGPYMYAVPATPYFEREEVAYVYIPNRAVGALIGTRGMNIRSMVLNSGANIRIASASFEGNGGVNERRITITGMPEAQWKAQYLIFEKMREERLGGRVMQEVRLTIEIAMPRFQVARIIGRRGSKVRELQRSSGAKIILPQYNAGANQFGPNDEVPIQIFGGFFDVQAAQRMIRSLINSRSHHERGW